MKKARNPRSQGAGHRVAMLEVPEQKRKTNLWEKADTGGASSNTERHPRLDRENNTAGLRAQIGHRTVKAEQAREAIELNRRIHRGIGYKEKASSCAGPALPCLASICLSLGGPKHNKDVGLLRARSFTWLSSDLASGGRTAGQLTHSRRQGRTKSEDSKMN